jgi:hypothetical protein
VMEVVILIVLLIIGVPIALLIWLGVKASRAARGAEELESRLWTLEREVRNLRRETPEAPVSVPVPVSKPIETPPPVAVPPPIPVAPAAERRLPAGAAVPAPPIPAPAFNWEQFMGVKLFAWMGGFALFLGLVFFLKYAFENELISPEVQVALEYLVGTGLLAGGLWLHRKKYGVVGQTLCATAVVALYAVTFASYSYYRLIGVGPGFAVMAVVTAAAFLLAVRLDAQVVAILGLLGGFLTPVLLSTGKDNPVGLFTYIALLDAGLLAVVRRKRWNYLALLAAVGTVLMQVVWTANFFAVSKVYTAMTVLLGFEALFLVAFALSDRESAWLNVSAVGMAFVPLVYTLFLLTFNALGQKPWIIFSFILAADLGALALVLLRPKLAPVHLAAGGGVFLALGIWTVGYVSDDLLHWALGFYLLFAVLHTVFPVALEKWRPGTAPVWWGHLFAPVALALVMIPVVKLPELSWLVWVCVLAMDVIVFALALLTASVLAIIAALVITLVVAGAWVFNAPVSVGGVPELLVVIGGFAVVFFAGGVWFAKRAGTARATTELPADLRAHVPALSAILPFVLLIMVVLRMPMADPSPVFGVAMLLVALLLGAARWTKVDALALVGLVCCAALQLAWHNARFQPDAAAVPVVWHAAFVAAFTVFPFVFRSEMRERILPWAASALAGPVHFKLVYDSVKAAWPNEMMGLLPVAFAVPPLLGLVALAKEKQPAQLAWFGGATLFFVTLIFPIQFERQWITIGWALEGAALLWLYRRVPHRGLTLVGVGLLCAAFARLALNPAVLGYHARSSAPILNWYLYAYGTVTVCLFVGAWLVDDRRGVKLLATLGTVLAFLLLNIEIADYFTPVGTRTLTFEFSGNFGRDMTYSIAWALFALVMLVAGIAKKVRPARYASLALLGVTLLKLFLHDLSRLNQLYRIGAFVGVAVILLAASFLYQKFVSAEE